MTYPGHLLKRLTLFILFAVFIYCLGKGEGGRPAIPLFLLLFFFFLANNYLQRAVGKVLSSHLGTEPGLEGGHGDIYTSLGCGLPIEMQTYAEMASLSFLVFAILSLAQQTHFFPLLLLSTLFQW